MKLEIFIGKHECDQVSRVRCYGGRPVVEFGDKVFQYKIDFGRLIIIYHRGSSGKPWQVDASFPDVIKNMGQKPIS